MVETLGRDGDLGLRGFSVVGGLEFDGRDVPDLIQVADPAGLVNLTDDNCGSTCGVCAKRKKIPW
ncbi:hypothetical protein [Streptomyces sp. AC627_RSS907]|uniref:hypothetical protein n=1 Tax=Streptomyces sp. AC627_RSS907 TaxID=2823684 RepID=UPI001C24B47D|nr:hypothetical protein [Streptomyces sp. AC627_RSS907]